MQSDSVKFTFYDLSVCISTNSQELLDRLGKDFSQYRVLNDENSYFLKIDANIANIPADFLPHKKPSFKSRKVIFYDQGQIRYCDYHSAAASRFDFTREEAQVYSPSIEVLHEITYLMVLSRIGKKLDLRGLHRFHACGLSFGQTVILMTMPMGGGKSTLLTSMARLYLDMGILSDDSVLIDQEGLPRTQAIRLGLAPEFHHFYEGKTYKLERRSFGTKTLLPIEHLHRDLFKGEVRKVVLLFGSRKTKSMVPKAWAVGPVQSFIRLILPLIVGVGLPMIFEYFWESGWRDFIVKSKIALLRIRSTFHLVMRAEKWRIELGDDREANSHFIRQNFE